jgi:hypothetical protein
MTKIPTDNECIKKSYIGATQSYILRRFAVMRKQSLATLFLFLCLTHLKSGYIGASGITVSIIRHTISVFILRMCR